MKNIDKTPDFHHVKEGKNGKQGYLELTEEGSIVFVPYKVVDGENVLANDGHPIVASGFTAYQYSHPDDEYSMQHYYEQCREAYKATLRYKAYYDDNIFKAHHVKEEADKAELSKILFDYIEDKELNELSKRYQYWLRRKEMKDLKAELLPFFHNGKYVVDEFVEDIIGSNQKSKDIAPIVKRYVDSKELNEERIRADLYYILHRYYFPLGTVDNWRHYILREFKEGTH